MANIIEIRDTAAPELDIYARLTEAQLRNRRTPAKGLFIAESLKVIGHALDAGCEPVSLLMERRQIDAHGPELFPRLGDVPVYTADRAVLAALTGYELSRGFLCAMRRPAPRKPEDIGTEARRIAVLEDLTDPTNVGAVFRSAAAMHMDGLLLSPGCCDPLHRRAVRVSMGTVFQIPWARWPESGPWPGAAVEFLKAQGFATAALALDEGAIPIDDPALARTEKLALFLGTEGTGLRPSTVAACDRRVIIPMAPGVDSLNVAAAGAVAFWELRLRE